MHLTEQALKRGHHVVAVARQPEHSSGLMTLKKQYGDKLKFVSADLTQAAAVESIVTAVSEMGALDILINNAGIFKSGDGLQDFLASFQVNSVVPYLVTTALLPFLKKSQQPKVIHITSKMGSVQDNTSGGSYAYRASKAALNMINKSLTVDQPWLTTLVVHPGWVKTDMGGPNASVTAEDSAAGIWRAIDQAAGGEQSGRFIDYEGRSLPW